MRAVTQQTERFTWALHRDAADTGSLHHALALGTLLRQALGGLGQLLLCQLERLLVRIIRLLHQQLAIELRQTLCAVRKVFCRFVDFLWKIDGEVFDSHGCIQERVNAQQCIQVFAVSHKRNAQVSG